MKYVELMMYLVSGENKINKIKMSNFLQRRSIP